MFFCSSVDLGLRSLVTLDEATNFNLGWYVFNEPWAILLRNYVSRKNKFIKHHTFSSIWSSVKNDTSIIRDNSVWILENGSSINFWYDSWCGAPSILAMGETIVYEDLPANDFIINLNWIFSNRNHVFPVSLHVWIHICHNPFDLQSDKMIWKNSLSGVLTFKSTYNSREV